MREYQHIEQEFESIAASLKMDIIVDFGVNRVIEFINPTDFTGHFKIVTWSGELCISGDYGTFVFSRVDDMFKFFRDRKINPGYWGQKLNSISVWGGYKDFCPHLFRENVEEWTLDQLSENDELNEEQKVDIMGSVKSEILSCSEDGEVRAYDATQNFENEHINFHDFWEVRSDKPSPQYIHSLFSIVWAIKQYDDYKNNKSLNTFERLGYSQWEKS